MSALPLDADPVGAAPPADLATWPRGRLLAHARSYGALRLCTADQAPVLRAAAEHDRRVLPRWQRAGDGVHEWADPGQYAGLTAWTSREHWLEVVVPAAVQARPEVLEDRHVSPAMFARWARAVSLHAHPASGRRCIVRPDRLAELIECAKRTVQRCQKAAEQLGLLVVVRHGRMLTFDEVLQARERGSRQRGLSNESALVVPAGLTSAIQSRPPRPRPRLSLVTPTSGRSPTPDHSPLPGSLTRSARRNEPPPAARHQRNGRQYHPQALAVARELVETVPWLRDTQPGRLEPMLRRFAGARAPWTAGDVVSALDTINRRLSRASMTRDLVQNPPALLAHYLRDLDPAADPPLGPDYVDRPGPRAAPASAIRRRNAERQAWQRSLEQAPTPQRQAAIAAQLRGIIRESRGNGDPGGSDATS